MNDEKRGKFLQQLRNEKGLTQKELSTLLHYSDKTISKWEKGQTLPNNPETLEKLCDIYNVSIEEILYGEKRNKTNQKDITSNMENIYKKNSYKYKKLLLSSIISILILTIITFIFIYFAFIRNTIKSYKIIGESDKFLMKNSTLLLTDKIDTLNFVKIESKNNEKINYVRFYYINNSKQFLIFEGANSNCYIEEMEGYAEYNLDNLEDYDLYLDIYFNDNEVETLKLKLQSKFINSDIFSEKVSKISDDDSEYNDYKDFLTNEGFHYSETGFEKKIGNVLMYYTEPSSIIILENENGIEEKLEANLKYDSIIYEKIDNDGFVERQEYSFSKENDLDKKDKFKIEYINYLKHLKANYN